MKIQKLSLAILAAAGLLAFSIPALAEDTNAVAAPKESPAPGGAGGGQGNRGGGGRGGMTVDAQLERINGAVTLTDDQKPKVKEVLEAQSKKMTEMRADTSVSQEDRRAKGMELRKETNEKLKGILTEEQFKKYEALPQFGGRGGPGGTPGGRRTGGPGGTNAPPQQ